MELGRSNLTRRYSYEQELRPRAAADMTLAGRRCIGGPAKHPQSAHECTVYILRSSQVQVQCDIYADSGSMAICE